MREPKGWRFGDYEHHPWGGRQEIEPDLGPCVASLDTIGWIDCEEGDKTNARLVAAAPDLLEALEDLVYTATKLWDDVKPIKDSPCMTVTHPMIENAKAALAKAKPEGEGSHE